MPPSSIGPLYCETPTGPFSFPAEPVNFFTNAAIVIFAILAFWTLRKFQSRAYDAYLLAALLLLTGLGSFLWHGFRTQTALILDVVPGVLFLLVFIYAWARRVWGTYGGAAGLIGFFGLTYIGTLVSGVVERRGPPVSVVWATVFFGILLFVLSLRKYGRFAWLSILSVIVAVIAFIFRTADLYICELIPFGTHFLWHIFLSGAAYIAILFLAAADDSAKGAK